MAGSGRVYGIILAGGRSSRMGCEKALQACGGRTLLDRVVARAAPQVSGLLLNVNQEPHRFSGYGLSLVADTVEGFAGPLAGILSGMEWLQANAPDVEWLASFAVDSPLLPVDLVARLKAEADRQGADIACAASDGKLHPVFALWPCRLAGELRHALVDEDLRKVGMWMRRYRLAQVDWPGGEDDPFYNVNTLDDLVALDVRLGREALSAAR